NAAEELLLLEYGQRLRTRERNVIATRAQRFVATAMTLEAVAGGAQASGRPVAGLTPGQRADFVVLDAEHPLLAGLPSPDAMLSAHVFASHRKSAIESVWVGGSRRIQYGHHVLHDSAASELAAARQALARMPLP
ncbi:MAG TPA: formimidoylglutamate deiminase, partial [Ramlibacter sp.]|nr:formimidoylglutamate deiminase [Ramlibacter sp.]